MKLGAWRLALLLMSLAWHSPVAGQEVSYVRKNRFPIPFSADPKQVKEVQLYLSDDQGRSWRIYKVAGANEQSFPFQADRDGVYWFFIRSLLTSGQLEPADLEGKGPDLRVVVDTRPPHITLQPISNQGDLVGVSWDIQDDNLDPSTLLLEARPVGGNWQIIDIEKQASGRKVWTPSSRGDIDVRLRAKDRAENTNTGFTTIGPGRGSGGGSAQQGYESNPQRNTGGSSGGLPNVMYVNHTTVQFRFQLEEVGPSGIGGMDLYYTTSGDSWRHYGESAQNEPPLKVEDQADNVKIVRAQMPREGQYGIILQARSGVGVAGNPPQRGDRPMLWIEVDLTKPAVQLLGAQASRSPEGTLLTIQWKASDKNLDQAPITLSYAEQPGGPWHTIEKSLDNTGRFVWRVPPETPFKFYVRVEARDRAGNIGTKDSDKPVVVDLTQPRIKLLGVEPGQGGGGGSISVVPPGQ